jgi:hypothetical protein
VIPASLWLQSTLVFHENCPSPNRGACYFAEKGNKLFGAITNDLKSRAKLLFTHLSFGGFVEVNADFYLSREG